MSCLPQSTALPWKAKRQYLLTLQVRYCILALQSMCCTELMKKNSTWRIFRACKWNESGFRPPLCTYRLNWASSCMQITYNKYQLWKVLYQVSFIIVCRWDQVPRRFQAYRSHRTKISVQSFVINRPEGSSITSWVSARSLVLGLGINTWYTRQVYILIGMIFSAWQRDPAAGMSSVTAPSTAMTEPWWQSVR